MDNDASTTDVKQISPPEKKLKKYKHSNFSKLLRLEMKNLNCRCNKCSFSRSYLRVKMSILLQELRKFKETGHYKKTFAFTPEIL